MDRTLLMTVWALSFLTLHLAIHVYLWRRLVRDPDLQGWSRRLATAALVGLVVAVPLTTGLARAVPREDLGGLPFVGYGWMGVLFYLVVILLAFDLVWVARWVRHRVARRAASAAPPSPAEPESLGRRAFLARVAAGTAVVGAGGAGVTGLSEALGDTEVVEVPVRLDRLPAGLDGFTVAQLSDLHIGPTLDGAWLRAVVERANALKPDLVAITGDLVDGSVRHLGADVAALAGLRARHGVFFVTGNHELYSGAEAWIAFLRGLGITVLENERVSVGDRGPGGASFDLAGIHDHSAGRFSRAMAPDIAAAVAGRDPDRELVLLAHQPRQIFATEGHGVGLQLSGHTHGGQLWPFGHLTALVQPYMAGLYRHDARTQVYVNRGTGYWGPPMRLGAPPEVTRIVLTS